METFTEFWKTQDRETRERDAAAMTGADVLAAIQKEELTPRDFLALLSPAAAPYLEQMARRARELTRRYFGKAINLFTPLYISDVCINHCRYCGFNAENTQKRTHLSVDEAYTDPEMLKHAPHRSVIHHIDHDYLDDPKRWAITWRMYKKRFDGYFEPKKG